MYLNPSFIPEAMNINSSPSSIHKNGGNSSKTKKRDPSSLPYVLINGINVGGANDLIELVDRQVCLIYLFGMKAPTI